MRITAGLLVLLSGCASAMPIVRSAAAAEFHCDESRVGVARMGGGQYRALGCGKRGVYECAVADGYVCTLEAEIEEVETTDQLTAVSIRDELATSLHECDLGAISVEIIFDSSGAATSIEFSGEATRLQRSCVAHAAANHDGQEGVVHFPALTDPVPTSVEVDSAPPPNTASEEQK